MVHRIVVVTLFLSLWCSAAHAQQDYFMAIQDSGTTRQYLGAVDANHTDKVAQSISQGRVDRAIEDLRYTLDRFPNHPKALMLLKMVAQLAKNSTLATTYFERAITLYPSYAITHAQYGDFLVDLGLLDAGIAELVRATEMDPKLPAGHVWLAKAYYRKGNTDLGRRAAAQARDLGFQGAIPGEEKK